jgi:hypothetical protein
MMKYRIYMALIVGAAFVALVFSGLVSLGSDLAVGMIGITLLMPGISLLGVLLHGCCQSPLPMLVANGLIYSAVVFLLVCLMTRTQGEQSLQRLARRTTLVVVASVALGWGTARGLEWAWSAPSDAALNREFKQHRSELETLVSMANTDLLVSRVADDFTWRKDSVAWPRPESEWGITKERWNQYRRLFRNVGLTAGLNKDDHGNIYFISHTEGSVVSGASKGFVYCEKTVLSEGGYLPCAEQHEYGKRNEAKGEGSEYRRLAEHWFIYSEWD